MTDKNQALPSAIGPYSLSRKVGNTIFVSGQIGVLPSGELLDSVEAQAEQALKNIRAILESEGAQMKDIVRATIFLTDLGNFGAVNEIYQGFFHNPILQELVSKFRLCLKCKSRDRCYSNCRMMKRGAGPGRHPFHLFSLIINHDIVLL